MVCGLTPGRSMSRRRTKKRLCRWHCHCHITICLGNAHLTFASQSRSVPEDEDETETEALAAAEAHLACQGQAIWDLTLTTSIPCCHFYLDCLCQHLFSLLRAHCRVRFPHHFHLFCLATQFKSSWQIRLNYETTCIPT